MKRISNIKHVLTGQRSRPAGLMMAAPHEAGPSGSDDQKESSGFKRRRFLGMGLWGLMGLTMPASRLLSAEKDPGLGKNGISGLKMAAEEETYWDRTDRFEEKLDLLESAWAKKDYRAVRSLSDSLRSSAMQAQVSDTSPGVPVSGSSHFGQTKDLPAVAHAWAQGWKYYKIIEATPSPKVRKGSPDAEMLGYPVNTNPIQGFNSQEPVELLLSFPSDQVSSLSREIRVAHLEEGRLREITSQVHSELRRGKEWFCKIMFLAPSQPGVKQTFLVFYGNPDAEIPDYQSDLKTSGEGYALEIENDFIRVELSKQTGQIERMVLKRERSLNLYAGGQGHGEPPGIDWAHDYVSQDGFQKFRTTLWDECPDYEIVKGPVCTIVRRYGLPYSPIHPVFSPSRLNMDIEYRFYSGLPYFHKMSTMKALKEFEITSIRDDEWVFTGQDFTDILWMGPNGKLNIGPVDPEYSEKLWAIGFYSKDNKDSFIGLFLDHSAKGLPEPAHSGSPTLWNSWHGQLWSRYPYRNSRIPAGTEIKQRNAYVTIPFTTSEGPGIIEELRLQLTNPLTISAGKSLDPGAVRVSGRLARPGEAGDSPISKTLLWKALQSCKDGQIMVGLISIVDLGFIYDVQVREGTVKVVMAMPHRGRPLGIYFQYGSNTLEVYKDSMNIQEALIAVPGVRHVVVEQTWYPGWSSNLITDEGRRILKI